MIGHARTVGTLRAAIADLPDHAIIEYGYWPIREGTIDPNPRQYGVTFLTSRGYIRIAPPPAAPAEIVR